MKLITVKAPARITLTLDIVKKLNNGFHELNTVKQEIDLHDLITLEQSDNLLINFKDKKNLNGNNTIIKAVVMLKQKYNVQDNVEINVEKNIPFGSGLAGGSSDAASVLAALNKIWKLKLNEEQLILLAREIGKDVPYFIYKKTCFDNENGILKKLAPCPRMNLAVVYPKFEVSSQYAYSNLDYSIVGKKIKTNDMIEAIAKQDIKEIAKHLHNDFEHFILGQYPEIKRIKEYLIKNGALNASMTGSGSCVFGIFKDKKHAEEIGKKIKKDIKNCKVFVTKTV